MRCLCCGALSLGVICKNCARILDDNNLEFRFAGDLKVFYFYNFSEIKNLLYTKHKLCGSLVYKRLAKFSFYKFASYFYLPEFTKIYAIPLDDNVKSGYSHASILAKSLKNHQISPLYNALRAKNPVKYAGKSLEFRKKNPRNFELKKKIDAPVILVDDIITTGLSMKEAHECLAKNGANVLFGVVLADARN